MAQEFKSLRLIIVMLIRKSSESQLATLILGSHQTSVLCHMGDFGCGDGGWTPVMKMNGNEALFHPFYSQSAYVGILPGGHNNFCKKSTTNERVYLQFFLDSSILFPSILRNKIVSFFFFNFDLLYLFS